MRVMTSWRTNRIVLLSLSLLVGSALALPPASAVETEKEYRTVQGGCFGDVPLVDGRVPTFLDGIGQVVDGVENVTDIAETIQEGVDAARNVAAIADLLKDQLDAFDSFTGGIGKYMPVINKIFKGVEILGTVCDVSTLLVDGYTALATGDEGAFVDLINDRVREAVVEVAAAAGSELGQYLGMAGGAVIGGPAAPLTGFLGGWLGGVAGDWVGEKVGEWAYDTFLADWIKENIGSMLFDLLCPNINPPEAPDLIPPDLIPPDLIPPDLIPPRPGNTNEVPVPPDDTVLPLPPPTPPANHAEPGNIVPPTGLRGGAGVR